LRQFALNKELKSDFIQIQFGTNRLLLLNELQHVKKHIMNRQILKILYILVFSVLFFSCKKENLADSISIPSGYTKLKEGYVIGASAKVEIWGKKNFFSGYNNLILVLYDSLNLKATISDAHIHFMPVMIMGTDNLTSHYAAPVEDPGESAVNGVFQGAVAFIMPSGPNGKWKLSLAVHNHQVDKEGEADFDITVDEPAVSDLIVLKSLIADSSNIVLSLVSPEIPKVGINDIEFTIHRMVDVMNYVSDDSYNFQVSCSMTGMGNSLPSTVNLENSGNGHYKGKVNFSMKGSWQVDLLLKKAGNTISKNSGFNFVL
jgi:hypothetical protein